MNNRKQNCFSITTKGLTPVDRGIRPFKLTYLFNVSRSLGKCYLLRDVSMSFSSRMRRIW